MNMTLNYGTYPSEVVVPNSSASTHVSRGEDNVRSVNTSRIVMCGLCRYIPKLGPPLYGTHRIREIIRHSSALSRTSHMT